MNAQTRLMPAQHRLATFEPASFDADARTIEAVWTTGARVRRYDWWADEWYDEELEVSERAVDMSRLGSGAAPVLDSHRAHGLDNQIGVVVRAWLDGDVGRAVIRFSNRPELAGLIDDIRSGIVRNISVGYSVRKYEITQTQGEVKLYRAVDWQPHELSFVTVPADAAATTRQQGMSAAPCVFVSADAGDQPEEPTMSKHTRAAVADSTAEDVTATPPASDFSEPSATGPTAPAGDDTAASRAAEIAELCARHGVAERSAEWIRTGKSVEQVRAAILDELVKRDLAAGGHHNRASIVTDEADKQRAAAVESLLARAQVIDPQTKSRVALAHDNPYRGHTLLDLARAALERCGVRTGGMDKRELVGRAFTQSGSDFPVLLESAMHKALQSAYAVAPDTWSRWCARGSVSDFRDHNRYRVGSLGNLDTLTELGEFRSKAIPDGEKASIRAGTRGNIINLSRQAIINDDLGAFVGLATMLGRAGSRTIEAAAYALLASNPTMSDGKALFHADHGNIGTAGAPTVASVDEARVLLAAQKDVSGNDFLDLRPAIWLGPLSLGGTARVINDAQYDPDTANKLQRPNMVRGLFRDVVDTPRLSGTAWYLFADPADAPVIEVAFLDGSDVPFLEVEEGFSVDGARWKVRLDFGVAAIDYRGAVRNAGA